MEEDNNFALDFYSQLSSLKSDYEQLRQSVLETREKNDHLKIEISAIEKRTEKVRTDIETLSHKKSEGIERKIELSISLELKTKRLEEIKTIGSSKLGAFSQLREKYHSFTKKVMDRITSRANDQLDPGKMEDNIMQNFRNRLATRRNLVSDKNEQLKNYKGHVQRQKVRLDEKKSRIERLKTKEIPTLENKAKLLREKFEEVLKKERGFIISQRKSLDEQRREFGKKSVESRLLKMRIDKLTSELNKVGVLESESTMKREEITSKLGMIRRKLEGVNKEINSINHRRRGFVPSNEIGRNESPWNNENPNNQSHFGRRFPNQNKSNRFGNQRGAMTGNNNMFQNNTNHFRDNNNNFQNNNSSSNNRNNSFSNNNNMFGTRNTGRFSNNRGNNPRHMITPRNNNSSTKVTPKVPQLRGIMFSSANGNFSGQQMNGSQNNTNYSSQRRNGNQNNTNFSSQRNGNQNNTNYSSQRQGNKSNTNYSSQRHKNNTNYSSLGNGSMNNTNFSSQRQGSSNFGKKMVKPFQPSLVNRKRNYVVNQSSSSVTNPSPMKNLKYKSRYTVDLDAVKRRNRRKRESDGLPLPFDLDEHKKKNDDVLDVDLLAGPKNKKRKIDFGLSL